MMLFIAGGAVPRVQAELVWTTKEAVFEAKVLQEDIPVMFNCVNKGDEPVRIISINSPCNCLQIHAESKIIDVGEQKAVIVLFRPEGRSGKQKLNFKVITDEGGRTEHELTVSGIVPPTVMIEPAVLVWNKRENLEPRVVRVSVAKGVPLTIREIYSMDENFITKKEADLEKGGFDVKIAPQNGEVRRLARMVVVAEDEGGKRYYHHLLMRVVDRENSEFISEARRQSLFWPEEIAQMRGESIPKRPKPPMVLDLSGLKKELPKSLPFKNSFKKLPQSPESVKLEKKSQVIPSSQTDSSQ